MNILPNNPYAVDRALHEFRAGRGVVIENTIISHPEFIAEEDFNQIKTNSKIIITKHRALALSGKTFQQNAEVKLANLSFDDLHIIIAGKTFQSGLNVVDNKDKIAKILIDLVVSDELLPTIIYCPILPAGQTGNLIEVTLTEITNYLSNKSQNLKLVTEAPLNLTDAAKAKILAFRSTSTSDEHYAIIVGDLKPELLIRIHSACYTGDLIASLSCDCGDQLRGAIRMMDKAGGGIIIYLMQEGRGIGLINKLRAYKLQAEGLDTVQANEFLGFDDEERSFEAAAAILKSLKISTIQLVTNNPKKISGLESLGIKVSKRVPLIIENEHNHSYLQIKSEKSGHIIK